MAIRLEERLELVDPPAPGVVRRRLDPGAAEPLAQRGVPEQPPERAATDSTVGSGIRQLTPSTQKSRLPWASVQTTAPPVAIASSGGRQKPSCVEVWTNTAASLSSSLTPSSLGRST